MATKTNATPQKEEVPKTEGPDSPPLNLSDAAVKKLIRTAKKRGYGSREPRFRPAGRASGPILTFASVSAGSSCEC